MPTNETLSFGQNDVPSNEEKSELPEFLKVESRVRTIGVESEGVTALVYWFHIVLADEVVVSTFPEGIDPVDSSHSERRTVSHWKQAAILLSEEHLTVKKGDEIIVDAFCNNSHIGVTVTISM